MGLFDLLGKKSEKEIKNLFSDMEKKIKDAVKDGFKDGIKDESPKPAAAKPAETASAPAAPAETGRNFIRSRSAGGRRTLRRTVGRDHAEGREPV